MVKCETVKSKKVQFLWAFHLRYNLLRLNSHAQGSGSSVGRFQDRYLSKLWWWSEKFSASNIDGNNIGKIFS